LAEKNRDLNQAFEKVEQMNDAKQKLMNELANMRTALNEKDDEIQKYKRRKKNNKFEKNFSFNYLV
jgi:hypothetical protein